MLDGVESQDSPGSEHDSASAGPPRRRRRARAETTTSSFGAGRREGHDATPFYERFAPPELSDDERVERPDELLAELGSGRVYEGSIDQLANLPDNSVALVVTSPPYFVGKDYELAVGSDAIPTTYLEFLDMLRTVFAECRRVLEPGGRIAINVANLGRKPYRSLSGDVTTILQDDLGLLLRGEVIWEKSSASSGSCAWGSFAKASNPVLRDVTERVIIASKGRFARALTLQQRRKRGLPHRSTITNDEFVETTRDVWRIDAESATRIGHPAPFPIELPRRLIDLYTYEGDVVVDPFAGSGTTLVAAARTARIGVGYDLDPDYVALAERRLAAAISEHEGNGNSAADDRTEAGRRAAVTEGKKVLDIASRHLTDAGFTVHPGGKHPCGAVEFGLRAESADGRWWWVDVAGGFTTSKPGLQRADAAWRIVGRLSAAAANDPTTPVLVLTPSLPRASTPAGRALRSVGPSTIFDCVELYDPAGIERLAHYASGRVDDEDGPAPLPGFWSPADLEAP